MLFTVDTQRALRQGKKKKKSKTTSSSFPVNVRTQDAAITITGLITDSAQCLCT